MHFTAPILLATAALAAASPASTYKSTKPSSSSAAAASPSSSLPGTFVITNFVFGCTVGCDYSFNLTVKGTGPHHPEVKKTVTCSGNLDDDKDYVQCGKDVSSTQRLSAYIVKKTNELKLQYEVSEPKMGARYMYMGQKKVYAATSDQAKLQKKNFKVKETLATAVA